uniref:Wall-associated receptor kinase-like 22 n=1 Tax=Rhizophora mucronata TaxID=61149 RepID=A0A2P2JAQ4_RHIMU
MLPVHEHEMGTMTNFSGGIVAELEVTWLIKAILEASEPKREAMLMGVLYGGREIKVRKDWHEP